MSAWFTEATIIENQFTLPGHLSKVEVKLRVDKGGN